MPKFCGWPAPASAGVECVFFHAYQFAPAPAVGQNNPPLIVTYPTVSNAWFSTGVEFPQATLGGSWIQVAYLTPPDTDPNEDPHFSILWTCPVGSVPGVCEWQIHATAHADGVAFGGGGPGTVMGDTAGAVDQIQVTAETQIAMTGGTTWGPDRALNINVYRGSATDTIVGPTVLYGVRLRFKRI